MRFLLLLLALLLMTGHVTRAYADENNAKWHLDLVANTDVPLTVGADIRLETPHRLQLSASLGALPSDYIGLINKAVVALDGYDEGTANVVGQALSDSLVLRLRLGWRPMSKRGFYVQVGYSLVTLGGGVSGKDLLSLALDHTPEDVGTIQSYSVESTLHMLDVELGWQWTFVRTYVLRIGLGFSATIESSTQVTPKFTPIPITAKAVNAFADAAARYLDETYQNYVFTPTATIGFGVRFF
jgi:hypothetical protein